MLRRSAPLAPPNLSFLSSFPRARHRQPGSTHHSSCVYGCARRSRKVAPLIASYERVFRAQSMGFQRIFPFPLPGEEERAFLCRASGGLWPPQARRCCVQALSMIDLMGESFREGGLSEMLIGRLVRRMVLTVVMSLFERVLDFRCLWEWNYHFRVCMRGCILAVEFSGQSWLWNRVTKISNINACLRTMMKWRAFM